MSYLGFNKIHAVKKKNDSHFGNKSATELQEKQKTKNLTWKGNPS